MNGVITQGNIKALAIHAALSIAGFIAQALLLAFLGGVVFPDRELPLVMFLIVIVPGIAAYIYCGYKWLKPLPSMQWRSFLLLSAVTLLGSGVPLYEALTRISMQGGLHFQYVNELPLTALLVCNMLGAGIIAMTTENVAIVPSLILLGLVALIPPALLWLGVSLRKRHEQ